MQSNAFIIIALILSIAAILLGVAAILGAPFLQTSVSAGIGLGMSLLGLIISLKGMRVVKTALSTFSFILAIIGIILNIIIFMQWLACAAFDFITVDASVGAGIFGDLFQY